MAYKYYVDIDMAGNSIDNFAVGSASTAPSNAVSGQMYFNSDDKKLYVFSNNEWIDLCNNYSITQAKSNASGNYPLLLSSSVETETNVAGISKNINIYCNPLQGNIVAKKFTTSTGAGEDANLIGTSSRAVKDNYGVEFSTGYAKKEITDSLQNQIDNLIIESGSSDAEVVAARGTYPTLGARLNANDSVVNSMKLDGLYVKDGVLYRGMEDE